MVARVLENKGKPSALMLLGAEFDHLKVLFHPTDDKRTLGEFW